MRRGKRNGLTYIIIIILTAAIVGGIVYFVQESRHGDDQKNINEQTEEQTNENSNENTNEFSNVNFNENEEETNENENENVNDDEEDENENDNENTNEDETTSDTVNIYAVKLEDNGASGDLVGCGDSVVPVATDIEPADDTAALIEAALGELVATEDEYIEDGELYNALYQSDLRVDSVSVEDGVATVQLYGKWQLGGTCDNPRFQEQIENTILQFPDVESAEIMLNDETLEEAMSLEGEDEEETEE